MAGPEPIQAWLNQQRGPRAASSSYRPGWDGFDATPITDRRALIPVAWFGRTATGDQQDPGGSLSLLRQLRISQAALPEGCVIVAYFYDVGSGHKHLDVRGRGDRHERLAIPIPRDGGIHDLLTEAANSNRRFHAVICERIDRIACRTYYGTLIEHQLQSSGVRLWTADEKIEIDADMLIDIYRLRSYLFCEMCGRRMFGKSRRQHAYYACAPKKGYIPDGHPDSLWVREAALLDGLNKFLNHHVFGPYRQELLSSTLRDLDMQARNKRAEAITHAIADLDARKKRLIRTLEVVDGDNDEPDTELIQDIKNRRAEIKAERAKLAAELADLEDQANNQQDTDLLRMLPVGNCDLHALPDDLTRKLFEALRLEVHYNKADNTALFHITLSGATLSAIQQTRQTTCSTAIGGTDGE